MIAITVTYADRDEFDMAHNAHHAWEALAEAYTAVRNQLKHGEPDKDRDTLEAIKAMLSDVRWRVR